MYRKKKLPLREAFGSSLFFTADRTVTVVVIDRSKTNIFFFFTTKSDF